MGLEGWEEWAEWWFLCFSPGVWVDRGDHFEASHWRRHFGGWRVT